jgi:hypothetical protein
MMRSKKGFEEHQRRELVEQVLRRVGSSTYEAWWSRVGSAGFCSSPIRLVASDGKNSILVRCKNRRAAACPSCSDLYAGDTWQLVHAGLNGGHEVPATVADHPAVFCTITAPGFGAVHTAAKDGSQSVCRRGSTGTCGHGIPRSCKRSHALSDPLLGQPLCADCYDYITQALFTWHAPELWARFTTTLRRLVRRESDSRATGRARVSFVKIVETQRRGVPHFHCVVRLDDGDLPFGSGPMPPRCDIDAQRLADLVRSAVGLAHLEVAGAGGELITLRFGSQIDAQPLDASEDAAAPSSTRRVAGYLAKYVTKSVSDFGVASGRLAPHIIDDLDVSDHIKRLLHTTVRLAADTDRPEMVLWLHTLGYRGHVSSKSRSYSTTMGALRATRAEFRRMHVVNADDTLDSETAWEFSKSGHATRGDRYLATSKALKDREARWARKQLVDDGSEER